MPPFIYSGRAPSISPHRLALWLNETHTKWVQKHTLIIIYSKGIFCCSVLFVWILVPVFHSLLSPYLSACVMSCIKETQTIYYHYELMSVRWCVFVVLLSFFFLCKLFSFALLFMKWARVNCNEKVLFMCYRATG